MYWSCIASFTISSTGGGTTVSRKGMMGSEEFISIFANLKHFFFFNKLTKVQILKLFYKKLKLFNENL